MAEYRKYSLKKNRLKRAFLSGLQIKEQTLNCEKAAYHRVFISDGIDGVESGALWGRFHMDFTMEEDMVVTAYIVAVDEKYIWQGNRLLNLEQILYDTEISIEQKRNLFEELGAKKTVNQKDMLLYEQEGRYLYLMIEVYGMGVGEISNLFVDNQGDLFMDTFPEVYREHGSFFHRYLSVFSSLYMDFQEKIQGVPELLDIDTAPVELLPIFGKWMGLDVSGDFLSEERLRMLIREAYTLNRKKGTRTALARVCEIVLGEDVVILEKNVLRENTQADTQELYEDLYGTGTYDVTLLVYTYVPENQKSQLMFLLNQFKPVRSRLKVRFLEEKGSLDNHAYLDMNACTLDVQQAVLDERIQLDDNVLLKE